MGDGADRLGESDHSLVRARLVARRVGDGPAPLVSVVARCAGDACAGAAARATPPSVRAKLAAPAFNRLIICVISDRFSSTERCRRRCRNRCLSASRPRVARSPCRRCCSTHTRTDPIEVRAGTGGVAGAFADVNDGLLASSQPEAVLQCIAVSGRITRRPSGDRVRGVVAVSDHHILGVKAGVAAGVTSWGVVIHLVDVDGGGCGLQPARRSKLNQQLRGRRPEGSECAFRTPEFERRIQTRTAK
jgi:hypothetical protein